MWPIIGKTGKINYRMIARLALLASFTAALALVSLASPHESVFAHFWLPNAVACAFLLSHNHRTDLLGTGTFFVSLAAVLVILGSDILAEVALALVMTVETALVVILARRFCNGRPDHRKLETYPHLIGAFAIATLASAGLGAILLDHGPHETAVWLISQLGMLVLMVPMLLAFRPSHSPLTKPSRTALIGNYALVILGTAAVFAQASMPVLFLVTPMLIVTGIRIGVRRTATALALTHLVAIVATALGSGPIFLVRGGTDLQFAALAIYLAANTLVTLPVAVIARRNRMIHDILRNSRNEKQYVLDNLDEVLFRIDVNGRWMSLNTAWERITGAAITKSVGTEFHRFLRSDDQEDAKRNFEALLRGENDRLEVERTIDSSDGREVRIVVQARTATDENGRSLGVIGHIADVTERYLERQALEQSEQEFATLASHAPASIFRADAEGNITYVSPGWLELTGVHFNDGGWHHAIHPDDREAVAERWLTAIRTQSRFQNECRWIHKDGGEIWVASTAAPQFDSNNRLTGYIGTNIDVSEQKRAEARLAQRESQLQTIADNIDDALFMIDNEGLCSYASLFAGEILATPPERLIGRPFAHLFGESQVEYLEGQLALLRGGSAAGCDIHMRLSEGEQQGGEIGGGTRHLSGQLAVAPDSASRQTDAIIASVRDVTEAKRLNAELNEARERAEQAAQAKSGFLANMSHEIRTPMNGMLGFADLLLETKLNETQERHVRMIAVSGHAMMRLLNDILDMSKVESGKLQLNIGPFDLRHSIRSCVRVLEPVADGKGVTLTQTIDPRLPKIVMGDPLRLRQILLNLIGNAVKFTDDGEVRIDARAEFDGDSGTLVLDVTDTGIGIGPDKLGSIFNPFGQADSSIVRRFGGTGLGLSISNQLAELMGGSISVESMENRGSCFSVRLPLEPADDDAAPSSKADNVLPARNNTCISAIPANEDERHRRHRILVAEDHDINQELVMSMVARLGIDAELAVDGRDAIEKVRQAEAAGRPFDLVLMDMQMPRMGGLEATRRLRKEGYGSRELPIIALTANCYQDDITACSEAGMQGHLGKPLRMGALRNGIERYLGGDKGEPKGRDNQQTSVVSEAAPGRRNPVEPNSAPSVAPDPDASRGSTPNPDAAGDPKLPAPSKPAGNSLSARYAARKQALFDALEKIARQDGEGDWDELTSQLHKLAGSAGYFGDEALGEKARLLEERIRRIDDRQTRHSLVQAEYPAMRGAA